MNNKLVPHCPGSSDSYRFYNSAAAGIGARWDAPTLGNGTYGLVLVLAGNKWNWWGLNQLQMGQCLSNGFCNLCLWNSGGLVVLFCLTQKLNLIFKSNVQVLCGEQGNCSGAVSWLFQWFGRGKRPLFLSRFAHICYINIWINGNGFSLWEGRTRRSLQYKPFCVPLVL